MIRVGPPPSARKRKTMERTQMTGRWLVEMMNFPTWQQAAEAIITVRAYPEDCEYERKGNEFRGLIVLYTDRPGRGRYDVARIPYRHDGRDFIIELKPRG